MSRGFKVASVILSLVLLTSIGAAVFHVELQEFALKVKKYTALNIPKNKGMQKKALQVIDKISAPFFNIEPLPQADVDFMVYDFLAKMSSSSTGKIFALSTQRIEVDNETSLLAAVKKAQPGDVIYLLPGTYHIDARKFKLKTFAGGSELSPIVITAEPNTVELISKVQEVLNIRHSFWQVSNLTFVGQCDLDQSCDHAIHIVGSVDNIVIQANTFKNFNAHIKANGKVKNGQRDFPNNGLISHNVFFNEWVRETKASVTPIDVVGGGNWYIGHNFIADFAKKKKKGQAIGYTYGAFLKGASANGIIENNLVICQWKLPSYASIDSRIGLSLGGGGTSEGLCETETCEYEHLNGVIRNNNIVNCTNEVGIYLNKAQNTTVVDNLIVGTLGIDARYQTSSGKVSNNVYQGRFSNRAGSSVHYENNTKFNGEL